MVSFCGQLSNKKNVMFIYTFKIKGIKTTWLGWRKDDDFA